MKVKCERDGTTWIAEIRSYHEMCNIKNGFDLDIPDEFIECPTCNRRYFKDGDAFVSDRKLTIL